MTDEQLEKRLRDWYRSEIHEDELAPTDLRSSLAMVPRVSPRRRRGFTSRRGITLLAAAAVVAVLAWGAAVGARFVTPPPAPSPFPTRLPAVVHAPSPVATHRLARNGAIAVTREGAIALIDSVTGDTVKTISVGPGGAWELTWAPDGRRLAYAAPRGVWVIDVSTGVSRQILTCGDGPEGCTISWAPDGSRIAVAHGDLLEVVDPDGSDPTTLFQQTRPPGRGGPAEPTWSPDGSRIAFNAWAGGEMALYTINRDGSDATAILSRGGIGTFDPAWSPDGSTIAYIGSTDIKVCHENRFTSTTSCDDQWQLQVMSLALDGSEPRELHEAGICYCIGGAPSLTWSPDGTSLAFVGFESDSFPGGLTVMAADGTGLRRLTDDGDGPAWQPLP